MGNLLNHPNKTKSNEVENIIADIEKQCEIEAGYITDVAFGKKESNPLINRYKSNLYDEFISVLDEIQIFKRPGL